MMPNPDREMARRKAIRRALALAALWVIAYLIMLIIESRWFSRP